MVSNFFSLQVKLKLLWTSVLGILICFNVMLVNLSVNFDLICYLPGDGWSPLRG